MDFQSNHYITKSDGNGYEYQLLKHFSSEYKDKPVGVYVSIPTDDKQFVYHTLEDMEKVLCEWLGIPLDQVNVKTYKDWGDKFNAKELDHDHEKTIGRGMITEFPEWTSPFWNMARNSDDTSKKIDVILGGKETIGSAERSTDKDQMRETFYTISDGKYAQLIIDLFGKERVEKELEEFLEFDFFPRSGGGIGIQRLISALK